MHNETTKDVAEGKPEIGMKDKYLNEDANKSQKRQEIVQHVQGLQLWFITLRPRSPTLKNEGYSKEIKRYSRI